MAATPVTQWLYKIRLCAFGTGATLAEITDFVGKPTYTKRLWQPGLCTFMLPATHPAVPLFTLNTLVEVWCCNPSAGAAWVRDFAGIYQGPSYQTPDAEYFICNAPGQMTILSWRQVAYAAGTANKTQFTGVAGETIMKNLVKQAFGATATTGNGRFRNGNASAVTTYLTVATDQARGNVIDWTCTNKNVLEELQLLALVAGGDFDLYYTTGTGWTFEFYPGSLGTNRSSTISFALNLGNMATPQFTYDQGPEKTVAIVGGPGQGVDRQYVIRTASTYDASTNDKEVFIDGRNSTTTAALNSIGDQLLSQLKARPVIKFVPIQIPSLLIRNDYFLGDLANVTYALSNKTIVYNATQQIYGYTVGLDPMGQEQIAIEMRVQ